MSWIEKHKGKAGAVGGGLGALIVTWLIPTEVGHGEDLSAQGKALESLPVVTGMTHQQSTAIAVLEARVEQLGQVEHDFALLVAHLLEHDHGNEEPELEELYSRQEAVRSGALPPP